MNNADVKRIAQQVHDENSTTDQFAVAQTPFHTHNGADSPVVSPNNLSGYTIFTSIPSNKKGFNGEVIIVGTPGNYTFYLFVSGNWVPLPSFSASRFLTYRAVSSGTTLSTGTKIGGDWVIPFTGTVTAVGATVDTAGTTGTMQVNILKNGTTILSTKITLDSTEKTSRTAATPPVISVPGAATGDIFTFNVDTVQTTPATGLTIFMNFTQTGI